jgi:phosphoglycolate phosphatase/putative hydrolase of the HAD superfamily
MKIYQVPSPLSALIFDMDLTLYTNPSYGQFQIDSMVRRLGDFLSKPFPEMKAEIEARRQAWAASHGGLMPSLSAIFLSYGITMEENIRWREETYDPGSYLKEDTRLRKTLKTLSSSFAMAVVTNNAVSIAGKTLASLGVEDLFKTIVGLDTCMISKPHEAPFLKAAEVLGVPPKACVSIGDRYDIDLAVPLKLGMGGILVDGVEDVYKLEGLFQR